MTEPVTFAVDSSGGTTLTAYRWDPAGTPRSIVQLAHGMGEHALRYGHVADALTAAGHVVYAHDHRGHGATLATGAEPGALGAGGWAELVNDIGRVGDVARDAHPGLPLALVGHSMGSFAAQQFMLDHSAELSALVLSGTAAMDLLEPALDLDAELDLAMFNAAFEPARTDYDWLSRDLAVVDRYIADPLCGFGLDITGAKEMFVGARRLADPAELSRIRTDLPVLIVVGDHDPINGELTLVEALVARLREAGLSRVDLRVYPDARHEVFNETNRDEVIETVRVWLEERLA